MQAQTATNIIPMAAHRPEHVTRMVMRRLARRLPAIRQQHATARTLRETVTRNERKHSPLVLIAFAAVLPVLALWLRR